VYALGSAGARLLIERGHRALADVDWTWKNRSVGRLYIEHSLLTADLLVGVRAAVRHDPTLRLIDREDLLTRSKLPLRVQVEGEELTVTPDWMFGLAQAPPRRDKFFLLESDRATMPVFRSDPRQTSIVRKLRAYLAGGGPESVFGQQLGIDNFRVLFLTTTAARVATMTAALRALTDGSGSRQFLFARRQDLTVAGNVLDTCWISGRGEPTRLLA
jgi:hypothetical protein